MIAGFAGFNFYTFAKRIKNLVKQSLSPEDLYDAVNQAAYISIISLLLSFLGASYASIGASEAWFVNVFGSIYIAIFSTTWFG